MCLFAYGEVCFWSFSGVFNGTFEMQHAEILHVLWKMPSYLAIVIRYDGRSGVSEMRCSSPVCELQFSHGQAFD